MTETRTDPFTEHNRAAIDPVIEACEFETFPFTADERAAINRYAASIAGVPDCFTVNDLDSIPPEFTHDEKLDLFRSYFKMLADWRMAIEVLIGDFTDGGPLSEAAGRYLQIELTGWKQAQEEHRALVIEYVLGRDEHGQAFTIAAIVHGCQVDDGNPVSGVFLFAEQV